MPKIGDYEKIMSDHNIFNQIVYTPMSEALRLLDERRKDKKLMAKVEKLLKGDIPNVFKNRKCAVMARQIATPNHESKMFIKIAKENNLYPVFFEYHDDTFTPAVNVFKHSLGQLQIQHKNGIDKYGNHHLEKINIIDFSKHDKKKFKNIITLWEEPLIAFHRKLFLIHNFNEKDFDFFDGSNWYKSNGKKAADYYAKFFLLFTCHGILFENFLVSKDSEGDFTKKIVLPSMETVINLLGIKPLIIPVGPIDIENDSLWYHHTFEVKKHIPK